MSFCSNGKLWFGFCLLVSSYKQSSQIWLQILYFYIQLNTLKQLGSLFCFHIICKFCPHFVITVLIKIVRAYSFFILYTLFLTIIFINANTSPYVSIPPPIILDVWRLFSLPRKCLYEHYNSNYLLIHLIPVFICESLFDSASFFIEYIHSTVFYKLRTTEFSFFFWWGTEVEFQIFFPFNSNHFIMAFW